MLHNMVTETSNALESIRENASAVVADRRRSARREHVLPAWLSAEPGNRRSSQQSITVRDLSLHGVGFSCESAVTIGATHWIIISQGPLQLSSRLRVISCRVTDENRYDIGAEFF